MREDTTSPGKGRNYVQALANEGWLPLLKWACAQGCPLMRWLNDHQPLTGAVEHGHLAVVQWAYDQNCYLLKRALDRAARNGHLAVLEWARGRPWYVLRAIKGKGPPTYVRHTSPAWDVTTCAEAAEGGHLHILQWLREEGCP